MNRESDTPPPAGPLARLRRGALWLLFALVLLVPKLIALRRRPRRWNVLRVILLVGGAAVLATSVAVRAGTMPAIFGVALAVFAIVVRPERSRLSLDERARQLGALVVVNGGRYPAVGGAATPTHLFVGADRVWVLDEALSIKLEIPLSTLVSVQAEAAEGGWRLSFSRRDAAADLLYVGPFAEHFARVSESTVRSQLRRELPVLP